MTSGGLHRRSTASGEREASDHAHHIWIVPAQHMGLLYPAVLLGRQQYRRLVQAEASSRRHPDSKFEWYDGKFTIGAHALLSASFIQEGTPIPSYET